MPLSASSESIDKHCITTSLLKRRKAVGIKVLVNEMIMDLVSARNHNISLYLKRVVFFDCQYPSGV